MNKNPNFLAKQILELYWNYKIPVDIESIANRMGATINYQPILAGGSKILGRFDIVNNQAIISIKNTESIITKRFVIAHELGHFALGHGGGFADDTSEFVPKPSNQQELDANLFALEIIAPKAIIEFLIVKKNITDIEKLATILEISKPIMRYRLSQLNWLPK